MPHLALLLALAVPLADEPASLTVAPATVVLHGVRSQQQLLVVAGLAHGRSSDLTRDARYESFDRGVCEVTPGGVVLPRGDGATTVRVSTPGGAANVLVTVVDFAAPPRVDFKTDVIAALSRAGCSQGACHGSPQGKGGFRLSLRGFDPVLDFMTLAREDTGRRTNTQRPDDSLILQKASGQIPHQGGVRFKPADDSYRTLRTWIESGCPDSLQPKKLVALETYPTKLWLTTENPRQQIVALARFDDGSVVDVTTKAVFSTGLNDAYAVTADGLVEFTATAEAPVLVRYLEQVQSVQLTWVADDASFAFQGPAPVNFVDEHVFAMQRTLQLQPAPPASDAVFLRRVFLDAIGTLPTIEESRAFLDSTAADKREKLVDHLLQRPEFAQFWALKWADVMRGSRTTVSLRGVHSLHRWLIDHFAADRPFDQLAREILTSSGNTLHHPAANFYRISRTPEDAAESFSQLFLGVRMQCAKCHNHPFEAMTQGDYYGLAAYFARVKIKGQQFGRDDEVVYLARGGEVQHPLTRKNLEPVAFGSPAGPLTPDEDRRTRLADWLTSPDNRYFARSTVNRIWFHLLGRGIVEPVDDFRDTNPPSNPELLDALADEFARGGYRFRPVIRAILLSQTYQLAPENPAKQSPGAADPARYFTRAEVRKLTAEQAVDAISAALGLPEHFAGYPLGTRAIELAEGAVDNHFLMAFSRPVRDAACDCAREETPALAETMHLLNNDGLIERINSRDSRLAKLLAENKSTSEIVEALYLSALSRRPTAGELKLVEEHIATLGDRPTALQDLQHALINSNEFLLQH